MKKLAFYVAILAVLSVSCLPEGTGQNPAYIEKEKRLPRG